MCGRYTLRTSGEAVAQQFALAEVPEVAAHYNIAPTQQVPVVRQAADRRSFDTLRWGLVPSWAKDLSIGARMINARAETVAEKPAFRTALRYRRCLIPADGFYEWQAQGRGPKQPFYFQVGDGNLFAFAGLWEQWRNEQAEPIETCTILTTEANTLLAPVHHRMPVIIAPEHYSLWLDPDVRTPDPLLPLLQPYAAAAMQAYAVSTAVNQATNDAAQCIAPLTT